MGGAYIRRGRLLYGYIGIALFLIVLLALSVAWMTTEGAIDVPSVAIGIIVGYLFAVTEYLNIKKQAKSAEVVDGSLLITRIRRRRTGAYYLIAIVSGLVWAISLQLVESLNASGFFWSFMIGTLSSFVFILLLIGFLLEAKFGKVYILLRQT